MNKSEKMRIKEIRSGSIWAGDTLRRSANKPEGRPRSSWNEIAIRLANTGFPSVSRRSNLTPTGVDGAGAIGASRDCEKPRKLVNCASRWDDVLGIPGTFAK